MNFDYIIEQLTIDAFKNDKLNQTPNSRKLRGTGRHKKSPMQNGNASVVCLLLYITLESLVRRKFYHLSLANRASAHTKNIFDRYRVVNDKSKNLDIIEAYLDELKIVRDAIAHAYIFEGEIAYNDDHEIIGISEKAVSGVNKAKAIRRQTPLLKLHTAPNQISFKDIAIYYLCVNFILEDAKIAMPYSLWQWEPGDEVQPDVWLKRAMKSLRYSNTKIWQQLKEQLDDAEYADFILPSDEGFKT